MSFWTERNVSANPITGTTTPIFVPRTATPKPIRVNQDYFLVQIHAAQVAFCGSVWEHVKQLIVASQVNLNVPGMGSQTLQALQRSRDVQRNRAEQLGLRPNLVDLVPAVMASVSISIDFILDKESRLAMLGGLINDDSLIAAVSLVPGTAEVARTVAKLADKIIHTFLPATERQPILQFSGDFDLAGSQLLEGYYVILGTRDPESPIPSPLPTITVERGMVMLDNLPVTNLSYVVLDIRQTPARTRALSEGAVWELKLREAEDEAKNVDVDFGMTDVERKATWDKVRALLKEAQTLLRADPSYLRSEAQMIIATAWDACQRSFSQPTSSRSIAASKDASKPKWIPALDEDASLLDLPPATEFGDRMDQYVDHVLATQDELSSVSQLRR